MKENTCRSTCCPPHQQWLNIKGAYTCIFKVKHLLIKNICDEAYIVEYIMKKYLKEK